MARGLWAAVLVAAGLWCTTLLPGVELVGSGARRATALLVTSAACCLIWAVYVLVARAALAVRDWLGQHITVTWEGELAFPLLVDALASPIPGYGKAWDFDLALAGRGITALGRVIFRLLIMALMVVATLLDFWLTAGLARLLGLALRVRPDWSTTLVGGLTFIAGYVVAGILSAFLLAGVATVKITGEDEVTGRPDAVLWDGSAWLNKHLAGPDRSKARAHHPIFQPEPEGPDEPAPPPSTPS
jgi:hypothetical protein